VLVGPYEALGRDTVFVKECNWLTPIPAEGLAAEVKLRSAQSPMPATVFADHIVLKNAAFGIAAGQACVAYHGDRVLGGGWITGTQNRSLTAAA
jgi:tRNA-specific 2-thiouridylase